MRRSWCFLALASSLLLSGCEDTAKEAWVKVVKPCIASDLSDNWLYFGPSGAIRPGSVWERSADGNWDLRLTQEDVPQLSRYNLEGKPTSCSGTHTSKVDVSGSLSFENAVTPFSAELSAELRRAKTISIKASAIVVESLRQTPFEEFAKNEPTLSLVYKALAPAGRYVLVEALKVTGYTAELDFDQEVAPAIKAKYSGPLSKAVTGNLGATITATWTSQTKLQLQSSEGFYIAGRMRAFDLLGKGFSAGGEESAFNPELAAVSKDAKVIAQY